MSNFRLVFCHGFRDDLSVVNQKTNYIISRFPRSEWEPGWIKERSPLHAEVVEAATEEEARLLIQRWALSNPQYELARTDEE